MNITNETIKELEKHYFLTFYDDFMNEVKPDQASELSITFDINYNYVGKTIKATKKETTFSYVMEKINNDVIYKNFVNDFKKLLPVEYKNSINVYPTSYGIGIFVLFSYRNQHEKIKNQIENILTSKNIDFNTEYSDARYVFRYKISKSKNNIQKINNL